MEKVELVKLLRGRVTKINTDLKFGFVYVPGLEPVFFGPTSEYNGASFEDLKCGDIVEIYVTDTIRGLFAKEVVI